MRIYSSTNLDYRAVAAIVYLVPVLGSVIFLALDWNRTITRVHCLQVLLLGVAMAAVHVAMSILAWIPIIGVLFTSVDWLCSVAYAGLLIAGFVVAIRGDILRLPVLYNIVKNMV